MQDEAPDHRARYTQNKLEERDVHSIFWSPYSFDLNLIEHVWNWMKDWIQDKYDIEKMNYARLREMVEEVWRAVPNYYLSKLVDEMKERCEAVIAADGKHTKF